MAIMHYALYIVHCALYIVNYVLKIMPKSRKMFFGY